jgi:hypothetical protein
MVSIEAIWAAMSNDEQHRGLMDWLSASPSACTDEQCSVRRIMASFHILKEIRAACKPFLEKSYEGGCSGCRTSPQLKKGPQPTYQDQFPSLSSGPTVKKSDHNNIQQQQPKQGKQKKRIRPIATVAPPLGTSAVWSAIAKQPHLVATNTAAGKGPWAAKSEPGLGRGAWEKNPNDSFPRSSQTKDSKPRNQLPKGTTMPNRPPSTNLLIISPSRQAVPLQSKDAVTPAKATQDLLDDRMAVSDNTSSANAAKHVSFSPQPESFHTPTKVLQVQSISGNPQSAPVNEVLVDKFVETYCVLIWHSLVPSTALEVHLLLRLLHVTDQENYPQDSKGTLAIINKEQVLAPVFFTPNRLRMFAIKALTKLVPMFRLFGIGFLKALIKNPTFRLCLPELITELQKVIQDEAPNGFAVEQANLFAGVRQTALLTLPFQKERDSRHHFKSQNDKMIFKNREENRDAFLYQLRSFLNIKGRTLDSVQSQKSMDKIRSNCRVVVDGVMNVNMPWFAQFFCELLLQVGLVPLEETDKELLRIAGKETLQKLHNRFSAKVGGAHSAKSSSKLTAVANKRQADSTIPKEEQAKELFPGHQEFFFLFLMSADSFRFNAHLRNQLVHLITVQHTNTSHSIEASLLEKRMVSRFLGVLVFSPSWYEFRSKVNVLGNDVTGPDSLKQLEADATNGLDLIGIIKKAQVEGNLSIVIPWVTEFLKMASWDESIKTHSKSYVTLIILLRQLQEWLNSHLQRYAREKRKAPNSLIAFWCLEAFFGEHIGLTEVASYPLPHQVPPLTIRHGHEVRLSTPDGEATTFDEAPVTFSTSTLFQVNSKLEELLSLLAHLSLGDSTLKATRSPGISRKLRPLIVGSGLVAPESTINRIDDANITKGGNPLTKSMNASQPTVSILSTTKDTGRCSLEAKMADAFFHQHSALKDICEFSVHRILKSVLADIPRRLARSSGNSSILNDENTMTSLEDALNFFRSSLEEKVDRSLLLLEPADTPAKIHQLAVSLAVARGYESGAPCVQELVGENINNLNTIQRSLFHGHGDGDSSEALPEPTHKEVLAAQLGQLTLKLKELRSLILMGVSNEQSFDRIFDSLQSLEPMVDAWVNSTDPNIPPETSLRAFFEAMAELDRSSTHFVDSCMASNTEIDSGQRRLTLYCFLRIASKLSPHPRHGFARIRRHFWNLDCLEGLLQFIAAEGTACAATEILTIMVKGSLLSEQRLQDMLARVLRPEHADISGVLIAVGKAVTGKQQLT